VALLREFPDLDKMLGGINLELAPTAAMSANAGPTSGAGGSYAASFPWEQNMMRPGSRGGASMAAAAALPPSVPVEKRAKTTKQARVSIDTLIYLRQCLKTAPLLADTLEQLLAAVTDQRPRAIGGSIDGSRVPSSPLLVAMVRCLRAESLEPMRRELNETFTESTSYSKSAHEMRHQECFAVKAGTHGLLDVARKTFLQCVEDIYQVR
jgi:hypothetical protein